MPHIRSLGCITASTRHMRASTTDRIRDGQFPRGLPSSMRVAILLAVTIGGLVAVAPQFSNPREAGACEIGYALGRIAGRPGNCGPADGIAYSGGLGHIPDPAQYGESTSVSPEFSSLGVVTRGPTIIWSNRGHVSVEGRTIATCVIWCSRY